MSEASRLRRELAAVVLACLTAAGWVLAPAVVRHQAGVEPLLNEVVAVAALEPAGGAAWRATLAAGAGPTPWHPSFVEVLEHGEPLARARPPVVRRGGDGLSSVEPDGEILLTPSGAPGAAPIDPAAYSVRRPRVLPGSTISAAVVALGVATVVALLHAGRGLARSRLLGRLARYLPLALAGWVATALLVERTLPWTGTDLLGQKMALLLEEADEYRAVFIGSSRVYRQLEPDAFDSAFAAAGLPMRSFNLGVPDMRMLEALYLTRWLLDQRPAKLELLVIDAESDPLFIREENLTSRRIVRWHDAATYAAILHEARRTSPSRAAALHRAGRHFQPFALHATQLGRGLETLALLRATVPPEAPPEQRGFYAGDDEMASTPSAAQRADLELFHRRLHGDLPRWRRDVARLAASPRPGSLTDPFEIELFAELERVAAAAGVETVFVLDPSPEEKPNLVWAAENGVVRTLLRFDDARRYAELYDPALRFDRHHVNRAGARLYSAEVARGIVAARGTPPS